MTEQTPEPTLTDDQQLYEELFGQQPEWHAAPAQTTTETTDDDEALYRALFG